MEKIINKQTGLCIALGVINLCYALLMASQMDVFVGEFSFTILYLPGLVFSLLIFPAAIFSLWKVKNQIEWIDYILIVIPLLLWLFVISGSFTNILFINPSLIGSVSILYFLRFSNTTKKMNIYIVSLFLWIFIIIISIGMNCFIPVLPE